MLETPENDLDLKSHESKTQAERVKKDATVDPIPITQFYAGRSIFITGGTGFVGKVLVEKLLRSCPDIKNIYLLIRPKRGQHVSARLCEFLNEPIFANTRREQLNKVIPVEGNVMFEDLGISECDLAAICRSVSIVFHSAASVRFDVNLKTAVKINMLGTKRLVELCHRMMSLEALVHVSTAYCNCDRTDISEAIYPTRFSSEDIASLVNWLPEDMVDKLTPSLIGKHPNTYTFTKALTEQMLLKEAGNLPVAIIRPSIVISSLNEPVSGWIDTFHGPTGLVAAIGKGLLRIHPCQRKYVADVIPVDIVINLMIALGWRTATKKSDNFLVYHCCTGLRNPVFWGRFVEDIVTHMRMQPLENCFLYPHITFCGNEKINRIHGFFVHYMPAFMIDLIAPLVGKKPQMLRTQKKITNAMNTVQYFCRHQWRFNDANVQDLLNSMSDSDRDQFLFDVRKIDWDKYLEDYILGIRKHLFKQQPKTLPASRKRMMVLFFIHQLTRILLFVFMWRFLIARSAFLTSLWTGFLKSAFKKLTFITKL